MHFLVGFEYILTANTFIGIVSTFPAIYLLKDLSKSNKEYRIKYPGKKNGNLLTNRAMRYMITGNVVVGIINSLFSLFLLISSEEFIHFLNMIKLVQVGEELEYLLVVFGSMLAINQLFVVLALFIFIQVIRKYSKNIKKKN